MPPEATPAGPAAAATHPDTADSWRQRWLDTVASSAPRSRQRLDDGRYLADRGAVEDIEVTPGRVTARVGEGRLRPVAVALAVPLIDAQAWERITAALASELRYPAALLEGRLPPRVSAVFASAGAPLVPAGEHVTSRCDCREPQPCKHVAALHQVFAARLETNPFLLLELRGRDRGTVLANLRRAGPGDPLPGTVPLDDLADVPLDGAVPADVPLHPRPAEDPAWLLDHLDDPPGIDDVAPLEALVEQAAAFAWRLAAGEGASAADEEVLLAELRARRVSTAAALAAALGWPDEQAADVLERLFAEGRVMRTGAGERARYRAAPRS